MARWQSTTSVNTHRRAPLQYPLISDAFVFPTDGRNYRRRSIRSRCIPLRDARHCRHTYDECQSRWGVLWNYYVILGWTTHEIWLEVASYGIIPWPGD